MKNFIIFALLFLLFSCGKEFKKEEIVSKYKNTDFSFFKGFSITNRYGVYIINKDDFPNYAVDYSDEFDRIQNIRKIGKFNDYLSKKELDKLIKEFRKYEFLSLSVNENLNVNFVIQAGQCRHFFLIKKKSEYKNESYFNKINEEWFHYKECADSR